MGRGAKTIKRRSAPSTSSNNSFQEFKNEMAKRCSVDRTLTGREWVEIASLIWKEFLTSHQRDRYWELFHKQHKKVHYENASFEFDVSISGVNNEIDWDEISNKIKSLLPPLPEKTSETNEKQIEPAKLKRRIRKPKRSTYLIIKNLLN